MAHAQKPGFVFRRNGRVHLNRRGRQFSRLLATEVCVSAVVMMDTPCSAVVWRVLATHSIRQFPLHFLSRTSPCAITFQLESKTIRVPGTQMCGTRLHVICTFNKDYWQAGSSDLKYIHVFFACGGEALVYYHTDLFHVYTGSWRKAHYFNFWSFPFVWGDHFFWYWYACLE